MSHDWMRMAVALEKVLTVLERAEAGGEERLSRIADALDRIDERMVARNELLAESIRDQRESMRRSARANEEHERLGRAIIEATRLEEETMRDKELPPTPEDRRAANDVRNGDHFAAAPQRPMGEDVVAPGFEERTLRLTRQGALAVMARDETGTYKKRARVLALQMGVPFTVDTEHGVISGAAGDWLVTNHPEDDPGTDVWPVSAERFAQTYDRLDEPDL